MSQQIDKQSREATKPWITDSTYQLMQDRDTARKQGDENSERLLHRQIRQAARQDKTDWIKQQVMNTADSPSAKEKWQWIKRIKKDYSPKCITLKNSNGTVVNTLKQADTFADYLEQQQWKPPPTAQYQGETSAIGAPAPVDMSTVTLKELQQLRTAMKNNKATGTDNIPAEAYKWLADDNLAYMQALFNQILSTGEIPQEWTVASVVEIYKGKGSHSDPEMYRPISLLQTAYKLFARLLQTRLATAIDSKLRSTQFGFRKSRSCSQPIHVVRRLQERADRIGEGLYIIALDWEKAFDRIHPQALLTALKRYGVNDSFIKNHQQHLPQTKLHCPSYEPQQH